ncbi:hypothetical protein N1851_026591 [Merluccius polli]|uniref:UPAR/Ly6 domain-containing protein n=1 Tax=Merluccius polli TaxID=89951 RepID=A0AA47MBQ7_MERPO|nr:hypothetical protein N1851_026591 [Merluccius polli]
MCFCLVGGLKCYECVASTTPCTTNSTCEERFDRCYSVIRLPPCFAGVTIKGCTSLSACSSPISCCEEDLCNNATLHNANKYIGPIGGLKCYECMESTKTCTNIQTCDVNPNFDRCSSVTLGGGTTKGCTSLSACISPISCCEGDLCNNANKYIGPSFFLMVLSSAALYFL